ncbi:hypothetical protein IWX48DRAFT_618199 [Phyllosticta citricarpa]
MMSVLDPARAVHPHSLPHPHQGRHFSLVAAVWLHQSLSSFVRKAGALFPVVDLCSDFSRINYSSGGKNSSVWFRHDMRLLRLCLGIDGLLRLRRRHGEMTSGEYAFSTTSVTPPCRSTHAQFPCWTGKNRTHLSHGNSVSRQSDNRNPKVYLQLQRPSTRHQ